MDGSRDAKDLTLLGAGSTDYKYAGPSADILETFPNPSPTDDEVTPTTGNTYVVQHTTKEFTSLCPKTGQPDFGEVFIKYTPDEVCVESKSLKLYLGAYRNTGAFMERITNTIRDDLVKVLRPRWLQVEIAFAPRGGIATTVKATYDREEDEADDRFQNDE